MGKMLQLVLIFYNLALKHANNKAVEVECENGTLFINTKTGGSI